MTHKRNNSRSFRFSDRVFDILENFEGDNLNDKFNNLVLYCFDRLPDLEKDLELLKKRIVDERNKYYDLQDKMRDVHSLIQTLQTLKHYGEIAERGAAKIAGVEIPVKLDPGRINVDYALSDDGDNKM